MRNKSLVGAVGLLALLPGVIELPASAAGATTNVVTGVKVNAEGDFTRIIVTGTEAFRPALRSLGNPAQTLINIPGVWGRDNNGYVRVGRNGVGGVRYGVLDEIEAPGVSILANTRGYRPYSTRGSADGKRWEIKLWRKAPSTGRRARPVSVAVAQQKVASAATRRLAAAPLVSADGERRISLDFVGADINDVLKALALQADVNIVTAADVKGNITVSLNRVTVPEALDMVARLSGYQYAKVGPAYVVGTDKSVAALGANAAEKAEEPVTEVIPYRFMQSAELGKALAERFPGMKLANGNDEKSASKQRMLVLTDTPQRVAAARTFVERLEQAISLPTVGAATEIYRVKYTSPTDLISILARLVPTVQVTLGPAQGFQSGSSGASAAFASSPTEGAGASAGAGGGAATGGGGTANPAGAVTSGGAPNTLLLTGAASDIVRAREVLESIDLRAPQMVFEARVMDIGSTDFSRIGLSYDFSRGVDVGETDRPSPPSILGQGARRPNFGAILRTPYSIGVNLDLLAQNGQARLLANPNISALDGQPAVVFIGDQIKYVIRQEVTPTGTNIQTETATVGITLKVTGKASPDGSITLYVHPEVSVISSFLNLGNGISLPQIATRFVDTTIRVRDGETIAIGGLIRESDITNIQKVPFLGDLPFLGQLFKRTEKNKSRSEVVVFLTSRILKD